FTRSIDFYNTRSFLLRPEHAGANGRPELVPLEKPEDASLAFWRERLLLWLRSDWHVGDRTWPSGSLLVADARAYLAGERRLEALFTPTPTRSLASYGTTRERVILDVLENVAGRIEEWTPGAHGWTRRDVKAPFPGALSTTELHDPLLANDPLA